MPIPPLEIRVRALPTPRPPIDPCLSERQVAGLRPRRSAALLGLLLSAVLVGCGGGGGSGGDAPVTPTPPVQTVPPLSQSCESGSVARLAFETEPLTGRASEISLLACGSGRLLNPRWAQLSGPTLALSSARSPALSIEPPGAGAYRLSVSFSDANGRPFNGELSFNAKADDASAGLTVRGEPSVWSGGSLSLRAWPRGLSEAQLSGARYQWSVLSGPTPSLDKTDDSLLIFKAPSVSGDSLLSLRAQITLADGRSFSDEFKLLVQTPPNAAASPLFGADSPSSRVYPYLDSSPHASALTDCIYHPGLSGSSPNNLCTLGRLPLLGQSTGGAAPSVEQVMQRVLVSNDWMGEVFERFLREQDPNGDFRRMLNATTAVVIGSRVRPAFYWSATGAIYLDASYLWLTPAQRDTLSESPDPRSAYGKTLSYSSPWRYVLNNSHAVKAYPVKERGSRDISELRFELGRLLYHELAHAADFLPPRVHASLPSNLRVYEAVPANTASQQLQQQLPFFSQEMVALGRVLFFGETATAVQNAYTPDDITRFFSLDRVTDDYSYSLPASQTVPREDAAMLLEEALMQLRYGVLRDYGITPRLQEGAASADLIVTWGQRGRVGDAAVKPRVALVLADLMPWLAADSVSKLAAPIQLRRGLSWGQNLDQAALAAGQARPMTARERLNEEALQLDQFGRQEQARRAKAARQFDGLLAR